MTAICDQGQHLVLSASSVKEGVKYDATCELEVGCHEFIKKPSYILYARAERLRSAGLVKCVDGWVDTPKERLADDVFARVCAGIEGSPFIPQWAKKYYAENSGR